MHLNRKGFAFVITQFFATGGQNWGRGGGAYRYGSSSMFNTEIQGQKMKGVRRMYMNRSGFNVFKS